MTIAELVADPALGTRVLAGESGLERPVAWAHVCEMPEPWNFLSAGDLLLSDGYSFPADAAGQCAFVRELAAAGMAGLSLGEGVEAPPLTPEVRGLADDLEFPILETPYSVPFVMVVRAVADAGAHGDAQRAARILRLYEALRRTHAHGPEALLEALSTELGADLHVVSAASGRDLLPGPAPLDPAVRAAVAARVTPDTRRLPPLGRLGTPDGVLLVVPLVHEDGGVMLVRPREGREAPDLILLQHAATIAGLEAAQHGAEQLRRRMRGGELLQRLITGAVAEEAGARRLHDKGLGDGPWAVLALDAPRDGAEGAAERSPAHDPAGATSGDPASAASGDPTGTTSGDPAHDPTRTPASPGELLAQRVELPPHLFLGAAGHDLLLVPADRAAEVRDLAEQWEFRVGTGDPFRSTAKTGDAVREARWALEAARSRGVRSSGYGERAGLFLPRTVAEGEAAVEEVLGRLIAYDRDRRAELIESLGVFFDTGRAWQEAAKRLGIHRQTLVYRMQKVEELTGRNLRDLGDQAELFMALRTLRLLDLGG